MPLTSSELADSIKRTFKKMQDAVDTLEAREKALEQEVRTQRKLLERIMRHVATHLPEALVKEVQDAIHNPEEGTGRG